MVAFRTAAVHAIPSIVRSRAIVRNVLRAVFPETKKTVQDLIEWLMIERRDPRMLRADEQIIALKGFLGEKIEALDAKIRVTTDAELRKKMIGARAELADAYRIPESASRFMGEVDVFLRRRLEAAEAMLKRGGLSPDIVLKIRNASPNLKEAARRAIISHAHEIGLTPAEWNKWIKEVRSTVPKPLAQDFIDRFLIAAYQSSDRSAVAAALAEAQRIGKPVAQLHVWFNFKREFIKKVVRSPLGAAIAIFGFFSFGDFILEEAEQKAGGGVWPLLSSSKMFLEPEISNETWRKYMETLNAAILADEVAIIALEKFNTAALISIAGAPAWLIYRNYASAARQTLITWKFQMESLEEQRRIVLLRKAEWDREERLALSRRIVEGAINALDSAAITVSMLATAAGKVVEDPALLDVALDGLKVGLAGAGDIRERAVSLLNARKAEIEAIDPGLAKELELKVLAADIAMSKARSDFSGLPARAKFEQDQKQEKLLRDLKYQQSALEARNSEDVSALLIGNRVREGVSDGEIMQEVAQKFPVGVTKEAIIPILIAERKKKAELDALDAAKKKAEKEAADASRAAERLLRGGGRPVAPGAPGAAPSVDQPLQPIGPPPGGP